MGISASRRFADGPLGKRSCKVREVGNLDILLRGNVALFEGSEAPEIGAVDDIFPIR